MSTPNRAATADAATANASTAGARTLVDELVRAGLRDLVLAPGSRSAPLAFAAHEAAVAGRLTLHTRIDERTAGFLALGLARSSHRPVAVVTTSGTATANLHPAVLEAHHSGVALVVLTADRPAALRGTGANQTTEQAGLYGGAVRLAADIPASAPSPHDPAREAAHLQALRALVARAAAAATGSRDAARGPVHLNLQFAEPLTPDTADGWSTPVAGRPDGAPWLVPAEPAPAVESDLDGPERTVVIAGDDAGPPARVLAEAYGWPLLAEPSSGSRTGTHAIRTYRLLLGDPDLAARVERVIVAGHPTLSRPVSRLLARADLEVVALAPPGRPYPDWADPGNAVSRVVRAALRPGDAPRTTPWLQEWWDRDATVSGRLDALLAARETLAGHHVAGAVAQALPAGGLLVVGSSNPIRDLDLMVPRYPVGARRMVLANRGLAGIDGTLSTAVGAALGRPRSTRAFALVGDVTFVHDLTGLVLGPDEPRPDLTVVVANDDGGSIFSSLEQGAPEHAASFERIFATPHGVDLGAYCAAVGVQHTRVGDRAALESALAADPRGIEVVEATISRTDRRALDAEIRALTLG